ncbi:MAG: hypothetical protein CL933_23025 [Deltaproteobacteria bacterium]|nr:hypothetical protein [Deltaproteobacteria bacterium]
MLIPQHQSFEERTEVGQSCMIKLALETLALVDEMNDEVAVRPMRPCRSDSISSPGVARSPIGVGWGRCSSGPSSEKRRS